MSDSKIFSLSKEIIDINIQIDELINKRKELVAIDARIDELTKKRNAISKQLQKEISNNDTATAINLSEKVGFSLKKNHNASPH